MMFKHGKRLLPTEALARLEAALQPTTAAPVDEGDKQGIVRAQRIQRRRGYVLTP